MKQLVVLMGPPGAGKDTQAKLLADELGYQIICTGDQLRHQAQQDPTLARQLAAGELADDQRVNDIVATTLDQLPPRTRIVTDGFPRRLAQAEWFDAYLAEAGRIIDIVLYLDLGEAESIRRLSIRDRIDDEGITVAHRYQLFERHTKPVLDYYQQRVVLVRLNGDQSVATVHKQIVEHLQ